MNSGRSNHFILGALLEIEAFITNDYLLRGATLQGAAIEFIHRMDGYDLGVIEVVIVEGDHPGGTYYAAELTVNLEAANKAASKAGIPVGVFHVIGPLISSKFTPQR